MKEYLGEICIFIIICMDFSWVFLGQVFGFLWKFFFIFAIGLTIIICFHCLLNILNDCYFIFGFHLKLFSKYRYFHHIRIDFKRKTSRSLKKSH
jgi:hypothetical protein